MRRGGDSCKPRPFVCCVCDDQPDVLEAFAVTVTKGQGYQAVTVDSPNALLRTVRSEAFDLILADLNYTRDTTSGEEGLDLLAHLDAQGNATPVVVMTAWGSLDLAVEDKRRGACDFIQKPWDNDRVISVIRKQAESDRRRRSELEIAANVQQKLFPRQEHRLKTIEYAGHCVAAREAGGDYYDFLETRRLQPGVRARRCLRKRRAGGAADGQPAGRFPQPDGRRVAAACVSAAHCEHSFLRFHSRGTLRRLLLRHLRRPHPQASAMSTAATMAPLLLRPWGEVIRLEPTATMLGAFRQWRCTEAEVELHSGDALVLYSDGVTEAGIDGIEEFGEERLTREIRSHQFEPAAALVQAIADSVNDFSAGSRSDDVTVVAIRGV